MATANLTAARLREVLHYDPTTGVFTRLPGGGYRGRAKVGPCGYDRGDGYMQIKIDNVKHQMHRLAFLYMTGKWPDGCVDHIDGCRANNRFSNLRDVDGFANLQNQRRPNARNTVGLLGVSPKGGRFVAKIGANGKAIYLGSFSTAVEAHRAYLEAKRNLHQGCTI